MNRFLIGLLIFFITPCVYAQPGSVPVVEEGGKKYYVHTVEQGNTLYGLQRIYGVSVDEIVKTNPGLEKGLNVGQKVNIAVQLETVTHIVKKKETLFGIAKQYNVTVASITAENPDAEDGVEIGQQLKITGVEKGLAPKELVTEEEVKQPVENTEIVSNPIKISFSDTIINHTVLDQETLYSISKRFMVPVEELQKLNGLKNSKIKPGDVLKIPVKKESIQKVEIRPVPQKEIRKTDSTLLYPKKNTYKIAIMLPFNLDKGGQDYVSMLSTEFYMGAKLALDSLEKLGLKAEVFVHDTKNDTNTIKKLFQKPEFQSLDMIIGPLHPEMADFMAKWCKTNNIRLVCPVSVNSSVLKENPFVFQAVPSDATLMQGLARHILDDHTKDQIILVKPASEKDRILFESFRNAFLTLSVKGTRPKLIETTPDNYLTFLKRGMNTAIVYPTTEKSAIMKFHNNTNMEIAKHSNSSYWVYGTKEWINFEDVAIYNADYSFAYPSANDFTYESEKVKQLHRSFRSEFRADMSKMAVQGFDVVYFFTANMLLGKKNLTVVMNDFEMIQSGTGNGFENTRCFIMRQENGVFMPVEK